MDRWFSDHLPVYSSVTLILPSFIRSGKTIADQRLCFVSAQSPLGQGFLKRRGLPIDVFESFYFIENGVVLERSAGCFAMVKYLRPPWPLLRIFRFLPRAISDWVYDRIARNRYRWFGKRDTCLMPDPKISSRFLV